MNRARSQQGLSLIEATIILMSLMVLGGVLAPSIKDYIDDARMVKVKEDCEAIGLSIARLLRDVGPCVKLDGRLPCSIYNRADLLVSEGHEVEGYTDAARVAYGASSSGYTTASYEMTSTSTSTSGGGTAETVNYVTEYVPRPVADGVAWTNATRLGGSTSFYAELKSTADLKRMVESAGVADEIRAILRESGIHGVAEGVISTLQNITPSAAPATSLEACSGVEPPIGSVVECQLEVGETLHWMAYRPRAPKGNRAPARLQYVRWAGNAPVRAYALRVETGTESYTFVVPALCANLSLMSVADIKQRAVTFPAAAAASRTTSRTITSTARESYRGSYSTCSTSRAASSNVRAEIGWYHTPMAAGTRFGHPNVDYIENQLIRNRPSGASIGHYAVPTQYDALIPGPRFNLGWRGAYLSAPIGDDPWGHKYFVNTMFLFAFGNNPDCEGYSAWASDTFCLSAGPNGWVETPFASYQTSQYAGPSVRGGVYVPATSYWGPDSPYTGGTVRGGDDFVYVIAGSSR